LLESMPERFGLRIHEVSRQIGNEQWVWRITSDSGMRE
jgi:hypothetical protein